MLSLFAVFFCIEYCEVIMLHHTSLVTLTTYREMQHGNEQVEHGEEDGGRGRGKKMGEQDGGRGV